MNDRDHSPYARQDESPRNHKGKSFSRCHLIMEYSSSSSTQGSPEKPEYFLHKHPLLTYLLWVQDQNRLQRTSLCREDYVSCINKHSIGSARSLFKISRDKNCNCFVFRKVRKCLHVLNVVEMAELREIIKLQPDCSVRSMLSFPTDDITSVLEETRLIENKDSNLSQFKKCDKCNRYFKDNSLTLASNRHQCAPEMIGTSCSWRLKLPFLCDGLKTYIHVDAIMLGSNELHHVIPVVSRVYDILDELNIRTSIIQILAQDPKYLRTLDILESQNMVDNFFTYHLYLYIVYRLIPYLKELSYIEVHMKVIPIFTVIRSEKGELSKEVTGFNEEEEIDKRLAGCPDQYKNKVQELFANFNQEYDDEGRKIDEYMKNIVHNGFLTSFETEWPYVIKCLDVKRPVYKGIRSFINQRREKGKDGDTWSTSRDFVYGKQDREIGWRLTNIFGVLPRHRISGNSLKRALLFSREKYNYDRKMVSKLLHRILVKNYDD